MNLIALYSNYYIESFYIDIIIDKVNLIIQHIYNTFTVPFEKSKTFSFASSIMKNVVVFLVPSKFAVKLFCWIALGSASRACYLLAVY